MKIPRRPLSGGLLPRVGKRCLRKFQSLEIAACLAVLGCASVFAAVPQTIHYQGRLLSGTNLYQGAANVRLLLYTNVTGGIQLYEDTGTVTVVDGLYATEIGDGTAVGAWPAVLTNQPLFVEVIVNSTILSPREPLGSVAYAMRADEAGTVAAGSITTAMLADGAVTGAKLATGAVASAHLAIGSVTSDKLAAGSVTAAAVATNAITAAALASNAVTTSALADGAVSAAKITQTGGIELSGTLRPPLPTNGLDFGAAVAAVGTRLVVGAYGLLPGATNEGGVFVFDAAGALVRTVTNPVPNDSSNFGLPIAGCGTSRFAVGANLEDVGATTNAGSVYLYDADGTYVAVIHNPNPTKDGQFGTVLAPLGTNRLLVGAPQNFNGTGAVYICDLSGAVVQTIREPLNTPGAQFGGSVTAIGTNRIAVGSLYGSGGVGRVDLFTAAGSYLLSIGNPSGSADYFGYSLAGLTSNRLAVGVPLGGTNGAGLVRVFDGSGALQGTLAVPAEPGVTGYFGYSLSASSAGDLLVSSPNEPWGRGKGTVYWYDSATNLLGRITHPNAPSALMFGAYMTFVASNRVAVGSPLQTDDGYDNSGGVYLFGRNTHADVVADRLSSFSVTADQLAPEVAGLFVQRAGDTMTGRLLIDTSGGQNSPQALLHVLKREAPGAFVDSSSVAILENAGNAYLSVVTRTNDESGILFTTPAVMDDAGILFNTPSLPHGLTFRTGGNSTKMVIASNGYVGVGILNPTNRIHVVGGAQCNGTTWINASDRNLKENLQPVDGEALLRQIGQLPIYAWNYRDFNPGSRHIGPMAQDFYAIFNVGDNDTTISTIDPAGIALAGVQALQAENAELRAQLREVLQRLKDLEAQRE